MLVVNVSPVAVPTLTAQTQCTRPHPHTSTWPGTCAVCEALPCVVCTDLTCLWPLLCRFLVVSHLVHTYLAVPAPPHIMNMSTPTTTAFEPGSSAIPGKPVDVLPLVHRCCSNVSITHLSRCRDTAQPYTSRHSTSSASLVGATVPCQSLPLHCITIFASPAQLSGLLHTTSLVCPTPLQSGVAA